MAWSNITEALLELYNGCLTFSVFPNEWKRAIVVTLIKSIEKDPANSSSYRPICLLPVIGKVLEGLILQRVKESSEGKLSDLQYGFRAGRSTEDAIIRFREMQQESADNYCLGIFLDISGAFNNLWWPDIIARLKEIGCTREIIALIRDYLKNRTVVFRTNSGEVKRNLTKGCPQGSLLGPMLWNVVFDDLIKKLEMNGFQKVVVYADDGAIILHGNTRNEIQEQGQRAVNVVAEWCEGHKMKLSPSKTVMMLLRGKLNIRRPPNIYLEGKPLKMVSEICYLGTTFEAGIMGPKIRQHIIKVAKKCRTLFGSLRRIAKRDWGLNYGALEIIYKGLFVPIVTYAAAAWYQMANERDWRTLSLAQRHALIGVTRAYRTASAEALQVLAGVLPIKLEVEKRVAKYKIRKGIPIRTSDYAYTPVSTE